MLSGACLAPTPDVQTAATDSSTMLGGGMKETVFAQCRQTTHPNYKLICDEYV
jgi:hypothetical protein